jgi:hypothetical protein
MGYRRAALVLNAATHDMLPPMLVMEVVAESVPEDLAASMGRIHAKSERFRPGNLATEHATARRMMPGLTVDLAAASALQRYEFGVVPMRWGVGPGRRTGGQVDRRMEGRRAAGAMDGGSGGS